MWVLLHSADPSASNSIGLTATDIAEFWLHDAVAAMLSSHPLSGSATASSTVARQQPNYFCNSLLDRASDLRTDTAWLTDASAASNTVYVLFVGLDLVVQRAGGTEYPSIRLLRFSYSEIKSILQSHKPTVVFLGVERATGSDSPPTDRTLKCSWFAVNVDISEKELHRLSPDAQLASIHPRVLKLARTEASIAGHARSILAWHDRYRFCPTCGAETEMKDAGYRRVCVKQDCRSKTGLHRSFYCIV